MEMNYRVTGQPGKSFEINFKYELKAISKPRALKTSTRVSLHAQKLYIQKLFFVMNA